MDRTATMSGKFNDLATLAKYQYPNVLYIHCNSYNINLAISHYCNITNIKKNMGIIEN